MRLQILQHTDTAQGAHRKAVTHYCVSQGRRQPTRPQISLNSAGVFVKVLVLSMQYGLVC